MKLYKGFNKDWQCNGGGTPFTFEIGKQYTHDGPVKLCSSGFHACEAPLDIWTYYPPVDGNQFAEVEIDGVTNEKENDTKRVGKSIVVKAALTIAGLVSAQIEWCQKNAAGKEVASGDSSTAASSGNYSTAASSGYSSTAASSGNYSKAACDTNGFACVAGIGRAVKGNAGSALACGYQDAEGKNRIAVAYVGENGIEADTWYQPNQAGEWVKQ